MKLALKWVFGIIFSLLGLEAFSSFSILTGICFICAGLICLPPTLNIIEGKINMRLQYWIKYITVIGFLFIGSNFASKKSKESNNKTSNMTNTQINSSAVERVELPDGRIQMKVVEKAKTEETTNDTQTELSKIPNRVSYEIYQPFVQFGFTDMGKSIGVEGCFWTYVKEEDRQSYWFRIYGKNPNEIEWIDASWTSLEGDNSSESAKLFFRELARVTFSGSNSVYAYNWVNKNINKSTRTDIGGVKLILQIFRGGKFRTLKIGVNEDSNH